MAHKHGDGLLSGWEGRRKAAQALNDLVPQQQVRDSLEDKHKPPLPPKPTPFSNI